jgi:hypothetical protein
MFESAAKNSSLLKTVILTAAKYRSTIPPLQGLRKGAIEGMVEEAQEEPQEVEQETNRANTNKWGKTAKVSLGVLGGLSLLMGYISAAGMKESEREAAARKPIDDFVSALNARNIDEGRKTLHYPHVQIAGNDLSILNDAESFQIDFQSLAAEGWTHSTLDSCAMRQSCDEKVHFEVQLSMHKAKSARYATYQALWVVTKKDGIWGIQCRSIFPSGVRS